MPNPTSLPTDSPDVPATLEWTVHPAREAPGKLGLFVLITSATGATLVVLDYGLFMALLGMVVLTFSAIRFLLPATYVMDGGGVELRFLGGKQRRPWDQIRGARRAKTGVLLSPFAFKTWLEEFRGMFIPYQDNEDDVLRFVAARTKIESLELYRNSYQHLEVVSSAATTGEIIE